MRIGGKTANLFGVVGAVFLGGFFAQKFLINKGVMAIEYVAEATFKQDIDRVLLLRLDDVETMLFCLLYPELCADSA